MVNLSYWVFEAFPVLAVLAPEYEWSRVWRDGTGLASAGDLGPREASRGLALHSGWAAAKPADGFLPSSVTTR